MALLARVVLLRIVHSHAMCIVVVTPGPLTLALIGYACRSCMHEQLAYRALDNIFLNVFAPEWGSGFVITVFRSLCEYFDSDP